MSKTFKDLGIDQSILEALEKKGYTTPTPIQEQIIPKLLEHSGDVMGQARTGTGKTAAFGIPVIQLCDEKKNHVQALVLTPTRELAIQVCTEIESMVNNKKIKTLPVYGGAAISKQSKALSSGVHIVVGTPGRVLDHIRGKRLKLNQLQFLVLDEADEMLDMGFQEDLDKIVAACSNDRQTLLFSATFSKQMQNVAKKYLADENVIKIKAEPSETQSTTDLIAYEVHAKDKPEALCRIIDSSEEFYGLVFCKRKIDVDKLVKFLHQRDYQADGLHGDMSQSFREKVLQSFRASRIKVLVATDVAARGIDVDDLTHVIHYAVPDTKEALVHRTGRTGRAGKSGIAITLVTPSEFSLFKRLEREAGFQHIRKKVPAADQVIESKKKVAKTKILKALGNDIPQEYHDLAEEMLELSSPETVTAALLYQVLGKTLLPGSFKEIETLKDNSKNKRKEKGSGGGTRNSRKSRGYAKQSRSKPKKQSSSANKPKKHSSKNAKTGN